MDKHVSEAVFVEERFQDEEIDLQQLFFTLLKYKWSILALAITVSVLAALWAYSLVPIYRATASLLLEPEESKVVSIEQIYGLPGGNWEYNETQLHILKSRVLAENVFDSLKLEKHPEYLPDNKPKSFLANIDIKKWLMNLLPADLLEADIPRVPIDESMKKNLLVDGLMGRLDIELLRDTQIISISYDSEYPELSASIPNELAEAYINSFLEADLEKTQKATSWITGRTSELRKKFEASERQLQVFIEKENLIDVQGENSLATRELDTLTSSLIDARSRRSEAGALYQQVRSIRGGGTLLINSNLYLLY